MKLNARGVSLLILIVTLMFSLLLLGCPNPTNSDDDDNSNTTEDTSDDTTTVPTSGDGSSADEAIVLTDGSWYSGTIDNEEVWFVASVNGGATYKVNWDDSDSTSGYVDLVVDAFQADGSTPYFSELDAAFETDAAEDGDGTAYSEVTVLAGQSQLYVVADATYWEESGDYRIKVTQTSGSTTDDETNESDETTDETDTGSASLTLSSESVSIVEGGTEDITATAEDADGTTESVTVMSSDESIATASVTDGTVTITAVAAGSATITVTSASDETATVSVTVTEAEGDGLSWTAVGSSGFGGEYPEAVNLEVAADGNLYAAAIEGNGFDRARVYKYDGGSWSQVGSEQGDSVDYLSLAVLDTVPYIAYVDPDNTLTVASYDGSAWTESKTYTTDSTDNSLYHPDMESDGTNVYVAYMEESSDDSDEKLTVLKYDGSSWTTVGTERFSNDATSSVDLALGSDGTPYVAFADDDNNEGVTVMKYDGTAWVTVGSEGFGLNATDDYARFVSLTVAGSTPYVAFKLPLSDPESKVMKYDGSSWELVGEADFDAVDVSDDDDGDSTFWNIESYDGSVYVAYNVLWRFTQNYALRTAVRGVVKTFDGTSWTLVGDSDTAIKPSGGSIGDLAYLDLEIDSDGTPYLGYRDSESSTGEMTVKKAE